MQCLKNQTFSNLLAKIVEEVDGTKCGELCCYKHWALELKTHFISMLVRMINFSGHVYIFNWLKIDNFDRTKGLQVIKAVSENEPWSSAEILTLRQPLASTGVRSSCMALKRALCMCGAPAVICMDQRPACAGAL